MNLEPVIGIEIHVQLDTKTKAWCDCELKVNGFENNYVCEVCSAQPGTLPVVNKKAVEYALRLGLATNCSINEVSFYDRKNYFYPDLPKGYQITQYKTPICENGEIEILKEDGESTKKIRLERIQLEEDTGKSTHYGDYSLINLNRAGTPLVEIVTRPDFVNAKEVTNFLKKVQAILVYLGVSKANLQDGNMRCDVNLSLKEVGSEVFGTRTEVKNLNSYRSVERAIAYEMIRQKETLEKGEKVLQQTLLFDVESGKNKVLRTKSDADDYRYFPEPDLLPLIVEENQIETIKKSMPELPDAKKNRFVSEYSIPMYDAEVLCSDKELANYFEQCCKLDKNYKKISNWILSELLKYVNESKTEISKIKLSPKHLVDIVNLVDSGKISGKIAKEIFVEVYDSGKLASEIVKEKGLEQNSNSDELETLVQELINSNPKEVEELKNGRDRMMGFFVGQVMKKTGGKANPKMTTDLVKKLLGLK